MSKEVQSIKIVLIGEAGVGKTCIISRYIDDKFNEETGSTNGGSFGKKNLEINGKSVQLNIWDTAGQERYQSITKHFFRDAEAVCFVYDITNENSFRKLENIWYKDFLKNRTKNAILAVVGNKSDLYEKAVFDEEPARKFAKEINASFNLTSAKTGNGINELFTSLAEKYLNPENKSIINEIIKERSECFLLNDGKNDGCCKKKKCC